MQTSHTHQSWALSSGASLFEPSIAPERLMEDHPQDEPLASGQRKRYLASLGSGQSRG